jgi:hypothetical protein
MALLGLFDGQFAATTKAMRHALELAQSETIGSAAHVRSRVTSMDAGALGALLGFSIEAKTSEAAAGVLGQKTRRCKGK